MPVQHRTLRGKVDLQAELELKDLVDAVNRLESDAGSGILAKSNAVEIARLQQQLQAALAQIAILQRNGGSGGSVEVDPNGALDNPPLAVRVDGVSVIINGSNELEAPGAAGGITQLTGDVTAGPGSGAQAATLANTAVAAGSYGNGTNVGQFTVDAKGRLTAAANVAISFPAGSGGLIAVTVLTSGTVATHTFNANTRSVYVRAQGPGGGGGGADQGVTTSGAGAGGGSGGYSEQWYIGLSGSEAIEYTVGQAGTGGAAGANPGNPGTTATVWDINAEIGSTITCNVGNGGAAIATGTSLNGAAGGAGGSVTNANAGAVNIAGQQGDSAIRFSVAVLLGGRGADSQLGRGGQYITNGATGPAAVGFGSGGAGIAEFANQADRAGGDGAGGVIILWEFS